MAELEIDGKVVFSEVTFDERAHRNRHATATIDDAKRLLLEGTHLLQEVMVASFLYRKEVK